MVRSIRMFFLIAIIAVLLLSSSLVTAQTAVPTAAPIAEAGLAAISVSNVGQLKLLGSLGVDTFNGFSPDSTTLFFNDADGKFQAWDITAGKASVTIPTSRGSKLLSADAKTLTALNAASISPRAASSGSTIRTA